jgi:hypothetical protein
MHASVTADSEAARPPFSIHPDQPRPPEASGFAALCTRAAAALRTQADRIAARWEEQSGRGDRHDQSEQRRANEVSRPAALVESLAASLASDGAAPDALVVLGLAVGSEAFELGGSLPHALRGVDLLTAMTLRVVETSIASEADASAVDGVRVSRQLQQASALLTLAVTTGYTQAMTGGMRAHFRQLRHDLRNPLGTIKSVLAMMEDETMPREEREHPRFRAMARRNVRSLGELIAERLSDAAAAALMAPVVPVQGSRPAKDVATPVHAADGTDASPLDGSFSGGRDASHDVRRAREHEHGQPRVL